MTIELDARNLKIFPCKPPSYSEEDMSLIILDENVGLFRYNPIIAELIKFEKLFLNQIFNEGIISQKDDSI